MTAAVALLQEVRRAKVTRRRKLNRRPVKSPYLFLRLKVVCTVLCELEATSVLGKFVDLAVGKIFILIKEQRLCFSFSPELEPLTI